MNQEAGKDNSLPPLLGEPERGDIAEIHRALLEREGREPAEGLEHAPWWVWTVSVLTLFAMGFYLGRYGGTFSTEAHELYQKAATARVEGPAPAPQGDFIYSAICAPCHQSNGLGVEGKYPPLAGSEWALGSPEIPVRIVLNGLRGPIAVRGVSYQNEMPAFGGQFSDAEIAAVINYVRSSWGNKATEVTADLVKKARAAAAGQGSWTAERLKVLGAAQ